MLTDKAKLEGFGVNTSKAGMLFITNCGAVASQILMKIRARIGV